MSLLWTTKKSVWDGLYDLESGFFGDGSDGAITDGDDIRNATDDIQATNITLTSEGLIVVPKHPSHNRLITIRATGTIKFDGSGGYFSSAYNGGEVSLGSDGDDASDYGAAGGDAGPGGNGDGGSGGAGWLPEQPVFDEALTFQELVDFAGYSAQGGGGSTDTTSKGGESCYGIVIAAPTFEVDTSGTNFSAQALGGSPTNFPKGGCGGGGGGGNVIMVARTWTRSGTGYFGANSIGGFVTIGDGTSGEAGTVLAFVESGNSIPWSDTPSPNYYEMELNA